MFWFLVYGLLAYLVICIIWDQIPPSMSARRKLSMAGWGSPSEPATYGIVTIDVEGIERLMEKVSKKSNVKLTLTHFIAKAVALAIESCPEINCRMVLGKLVPRKTIDTCLLVACEDPITKKNDLANVTIRSTNSKSLKKIADEVSLEAERLRKGKNNHHVKTLQPLRLLPTIIMRPLIQLSVWLSVSLNISIPAMGIKADQFGSCIITSVAPFDIEEGLVPLAPFTRNPLFVCIGKATKKPFVIEETNEIVARKQMTVTATVDHRYVDGKELGKLVKKFTEVCRNPEKYFDVEKESI
ncbi:hypothetical protein ABK040_004571 [Willaertia magna]